VTDSNFGTWLDSYEAGEFADRVDQHLRDLLRAAVGLQKKGSLTLKLVVDPTGTKVVTVATVESKLPQPDPEQQMFWVGLDGSLHDRPTSDVTMDMVDTSTGEILTSN